MCDIELQLNTLLWKESTFQTGGGQPYKTPSVTVLDLQGEGVLCASGQMGISDWVEEGDDEAINF